MTPTDVEAATITAAMAGSEDAFTQLYREHKPAVTRTVWSVLRRDDEDVVQEVFLLAFTRLNQFQHGSRFRTWITRIAINKAKERFRTPQPLDHVQGRLEEFELAEDIRFGREDASLSRAIDRIALDRAIQSLCPSLQRSVEEWMQDRPHKSIAAGRTIAASKSQRHRAVIALRRRLLPGARAHFSQSLGETNVESIHLR